MLVVRIGQGVIVKEKIIFTHPQSRVSLTYINRNINSNVNQTVNHTQRLTMPPLSNKMKDQYPKIAIIPRLPNPNQPGYNLKLIGKQLSFVSKKAGDLQDIISRLCSQEQEQDDFSNLSNILDNGYSLINSHFKAINNENENFEKIIGNIESIKNKDKNLMIMYAYGMKDSSISENKELLNLIKTYKSKLISSID